MTKKNSPQGHRYKGENKAGNQSSLAGKNRYGRGVAAERSAEILLRLKGYSIIQRRFRTPVGEIDILASRGQTLVIVEVKRRSSHAEAAGVISFAQQQRLRRAGRYVMSRQRNNGNHVLRFDVVLVNKWGWPHHLVNVWSDDED